MGEVVNLRRARKAKARDRAAQAAAENRTRHGLAKAVRDTQEREAGRAAALHEGHKREE